jgi:uncharacterized coiled-coil protein SlyX
MNSTYEKLLEGIERQLADNTRDIERAEEKMRELNVERRKLLLGKYGIQNEMERIK